MNEIQTLRWNTLKNIGVPFSVVKDKVRDIYNINIDEVNISDFLENISMKYSQIDIDQLLFHLEEYSFKKMFIFSVKDKVIEELCTDILKEEFMVRNRIKGLYDNEQLAGINEDMSCVYVSEKDKYFIIKMAQRKIVEEEEMLETGCIGYKQYEYYDFVKFVVDLNESLLFMFVNDFYSKACYGNSSAKAITNKKSAFYNLFLNGNQASLMKYGMEDALNKYVLDFFQNLVDENGEFKEFGEVENNISRKITIIETEDPIDTKNNLRSSERDSRHNKYRLQAINYALQNEEHCVKMIECIIGSRIIIFKSSGEIILQGPFLGMEVISNVCKEVFPRYKLPEYESEGSRENLI
ncbi:hypothetical protein [Clostridium cylindrosporum]|uniref:Uncharacterized protein n=1 Tax=Clostridium cylindrosporum DSM 605 TaxID=1121307 RepID=A0A0J8G1H0_CLOCY|nr:hypothetical protein [Clostridium cylindrosporum]KMT21606.1 hypothetical protein CLCY_2c03680 [Clostridium cylindrosporum DSM 605]